MKKFSFLTILLCLSVSLAYAQKSRTPVKLIKPQTIQTATAVEIPEAEWQNLTAALKAEMWEKSALLAAQYLQKIKIENDKKQLAQLRYFYLYALAGKILALSNANRTLAENAAWQELDKAVSAFAGKEFVLPPRRFLPECREVLNYICPVKDNERALRVTATNQAGTAIHSFDYVAFENVISINRFLDQEIFLGGKFKRAEFNQDMSKPWVMRLIFEKGFVNLVGKNNK